MLMERSKVPTEPKKRDFFPAKNPVDARREVVSGVGWVTELVPPGKIASWTKALYLDYHRPGFKNHQGLRTRH
jgi:hypothetical protein